MKSMTVYDAQYSPERIRKMNEIKNKTKISQPEFGEILMFVCII